MATGFLPTTPTLPSQAESGVHTFVVKHKDYDSPDANFVIRIREKGDNTPPMCTEFRGHRAKLAAASVPFSDMFEIGKDDDGEGVLDLVGGPEIWNRLLQSVYNDPDNFTTLYDQAPAFLLDLVQEAHMYGMVTLYHYAEACLIAQLDSVDFDFALRLYAKASRCHRALLAEMAMSRAKRGDLDDFEVTTLAMLEGMELARFVKSLSAWRQQPSGHIMGL